MFARWNSDEECFSEMLLFHSEDNARAIADGIRARAESNTLFKSNDIEMKIMKGVGDEIVVYGPCSWELRDPVGDVVTTKFMVNFFNKWFNKVPLAYRNIMLDHENFQIGEPLLSWQSPETGEKYYTHVHEKAPMLLAKIRPDDGLQLTRKIRAEILNSNYKSYSISWFPVYYDVKMEEGQEFPTNYHWDGDPIEVTICRYGMVEAAKFNVVKHKLRSASSLMQYPEVLERIKSPECLIKLLNVVLNKPFGEWDDFDDCVRSVSHRSPPPKDPEAYCAAIMQQVEDGKAGANLTPPGTVKALSLPDKGKVREVQVPLELRLKLHRIFQEAKKIGGKGKAKDNSN